MVYKPLEERTYLEYLKIAGWRLARISHTFSGNSLTLSPDLHRQDSEAVLHEHCPRYPADESQVTERRFASKKCEKYGLVKGSSDCNLLDAKGIFVCSIRISHGKGQKREVVAFSVNKTEKKFKDRGLKWPPRKK